MKKLSLFLAVLCLLLVGGYLYLRFVLQKDVPGRQQKASASALDLEPLFIAKLQQMVKDASNGLYQLSIDSLRMDILASQVTLINTALYPDSAVLSKLKTERALPDNVFKIRLHTLHLDGIGVRDVLSGKKIQLDTILIHHPEVEIFYEKNTTGKENKDTATLYRKLSRHIESFAVKRIEVVGGNIISHQPKKNKTARFKEVSIGLTDVLIDPTTQYETDRFLFAADAALTLENYSMQTGDGLYDVDLNSLQVHPNSQEVSIREIKLSPRYSKEAFQKKISRRKERYTIAASGIKLSGIDWWRLANKESIEASGIHIQDAHVEIYLDRSQPQPASKMGKFPHQMIMKLPYPVAIQQLSLQNTDLVYEEFNPNSGKTGTIKFDNIQATVDNITNKPSVIRQNSQTKLDASARFLSFIPVQVNMRLNLAEHEKGSFSARVHLEGFDATKINSVTEPLGLFHIKSGTVKKLEATVEGSNHNGTGSILLLYDDLHIAALKKDDDESDGLKKKVLMSLFANMTIKDSNPKSGESPRKADSHYKRKPEKSFFNLVWKTMLAGILKSIGAPEKLADK